VLHWLLRPQLTGRFLKVHGAFLALMAPFGFHWLPQGPVLRTITGVLFGFAVITFLGLPLAGSAVARIGDRLDWRLWLHPPGAWAEPAAKDQTAIPPTAHWLYTIGLAGALMVVPALAALGGRCGAYLLSSLVCAGAVALSALLLADAVLAIAGLTRSARTLLHIREPGAPACCRLTRPERL
jgi:hypothetical protein